MARMRGIKPDLYADVDLSDRSIWARWIFPGLWMQADREGRLVDCPKRLKREILPYDDQDMDALLQELHDHRFIVRYEVDGQRFIWIPTFTDHQRISGTERESDLFVPEWEGESSWKRGVHGKENRGRTEDALRTHDGLQKGKEEERNKKGKERNARGASSLAIDLLMTLLPESHQTDQMRQALDGYIKVRASQRFKPWTEAMMPSMAKKLGEHDVGTAIGMIENSSANGYMGIFLPKENHKNGHLPAGKAKDKTAIDAAWKD